MVLSRGINVSIPLTGALVNSSAISAILLLEYGICLVVLSFMLLDCLNNTFFTIFYGVEARTSTNPASNSRVSG